MLENTRHEMENGRIFYEGHFSEYNVNNISHTLEKSSCEYKRQNSKNLLIPEISRHHHSGDHYPGAEEAGDHLQPPVLQRRLHQELLPAARASPASTPALDRAGGCGGLQLELLHLGPCVPGAQPDVGIHGLHGEAGETHPTY